MIQEIDIAYFYEHAARELDVACAVASILGKEYGLKVEIVQWPHGYHRISGKMKPRVIVLPFCYSEDSFVLCLLDYLKTIYFNLSWEQLFYQGNRIAKAPRRDFACNHVIHHAWSESYASFLQEAGVPRNHIFTNGNLTYTLYDEPYRQYFQQRNALASKYHLDPEKKWIFFPENYNWAFYSEATLNTFIKKGQSPEDVFTLKEFCHKSLKEVMKWCNAVAEYKGIELIIRPRPATPLQDFKAVAQQIIKTIPDHIHLIQEKSVREWIIASDIVISSHSTSLIEAAVAGKAIYMLEPYQMPAALFNEWQNLVPRIKNQSAFLDICLNDNVSDKGQRLGEWARTTMMANGDAIRNLADYLARICSGEVQPPLLPTIKSATPPSNLPVPPWLLFGYRKFRWLKKRRNPPTEIEPEYRKDIVSPSEIEERVNRWGQILEGELKSA